MRTRVWRPAGRLAVALVSHLVAPQPGFDFATEIDQFLSSAQAVAFDPSTTAILEEAVSRDIPWIRLDEHSRIQLGQSAYAQRIRATMTSRTGDRAVHVAADKDLTSTVLASAGLPVPRGMKVRSTDLAVAAPGRLGYPCVVKPLDGTLDRGVCLDLGDEQAGRDVRPITVASPLEAPVSSSRSWPGASTGASSSAAGWWRSPRGCQPMWSATGCTPSPSSSRPATPARAQASATKRF